VSVDFAERAAHNEEVFRQINEKIEQGAGQHQVASTLPFHCECGRLTCTDTIELHPGTYDEIASCPLHFVIKPEHRIPEIERVVAEQIDYIVVEKLGEARDEIEREHPRERHRDS
jgi:hypothetical protein